MTETPKLPDRYTLIDQIGEGATCTVYRAHDLQLNRDVAIKVVRRNLAIHARFRARFSREVALGAEVIHPRIIPVLDSGRLENGCPFVSLAHADSGSLSDLLKKRPPVAEAIRIIEQVLDALAHLHAHGLLHQDLKPANVLLHQCSEGGPDAWVADLGVAGAVAELTLHQTGISGTPTWMAPEQRAGRYAELGTWTDLYAVGLMLFEILGGDRSGREPGTRRLIDPLPSGPLGLNKDVPQALEDVVRALLDPDPRQRYDRAADVMCAIRTALSGTKLSMLVPPPIGGHVGQSFSNVLVQEGLQEITSFSPSKNQDSSVRWNRVAQETMPIEPPPHPASGAEAGGVALIGLRDPPIEAYEGVRWLLWQKAREVVQSGEPRVVLLVGKSGSGKSNTAKSVARTIEASGHMETVLLRYNSPPGADDGYRGAVQEILAPWNENRADLQARLKRWLSRDQQRTPDEVETEASVLARWCGYLEEGETPVNAAVGLAYLYRHLDARAWRGGAVILLEEAHLAQEDGDGLNICDALIDKSVGERPFLAVATLSAEAIAADPKLAAHVSSLESRGATKISMPTMSDGDIRAFLRQSMNLSPQLAETVATLCDGSPVRAVLLVRDWATRRYLVQLDGPDLTLREDIDIDTITHDDANELFLSRLRGAVEATENPEAAYEALAATALAGQEPPVMVVREINPEGLDALLATGLIRQTGWRLAFEHPDIHLAAMQVAMGRPTVQDLHRRIASAWERLGEKTGADVDLPVGVHRLHSGETSGAVIPLLRAARRTLDEGRTALALNAAQLGVAAADRAGAIAARAEARMRYAEGLLNMGRTKEANDVLNKARDLGHLDRRTQARIWVLLAQVESQQGRLDQAKNYLESAEVTFEATRDREGLIETAHAMGGLLRLEGRPNEAAKRYARMLRLNRDDHRIEVRALRGLVDARTVSGRLEGIEPLVHRLRAAALATGDTRRIAQATYAASLVYLACQDFDQAERYCHTSRALAATVGDHRLQVDSENNLGEVYRYRGDIRSAERMYEGVARRASERGWYGSAAVGHLNLALVNLQRQSPRLARIALDQAEACLQQHPRHWAWLFIGLMRALWAAEDGEERTCRAWWAVANERGLGRVVSSDLRDPLERLSRATKRHGWNDIADRAFQYQQAIERAEAPTSPQPDI